MGVPGNVGRLKRFFIPPQDMDSHAPSLKGAEAIHAARVLRMKPGSWIELFDGEGRSANAVITAVHRDEVNLTLSEKPRRDPAPETEIVLAISLIRWEKMKMVLQKTVELGVSRIWPFESGRSVVQSNDSQPQGFVERCQRVLIEAMKQCGENRLPKVLLPSSLEHTLARAHPGWLKLFLWEGESMTRLQEIAASGRAPAGVVIAVGPEGGFSDDEAEMARSLGYTIAGLGRRILRAETAAIAAVAIAQYTWGDLGSESPP
jgi:16S rRNA (uracil1498-N3)-methyltransferase